MITSKIGMNCDGNAVACSGNRLSFQGRWYVCPGLLSRLRGREFDVYYDRRDVGVLYIFVEGEYVGEAYCPQFMGGRVSEWEARAMRKHDEEQARIAREQGLPVRARIQDEARVARRRPSTEIRASEQARQWDRQRLVVSSLNAKKLCIPGTKGTLWGLMT